MRNVGPPAPALAHPPNGRAHDEDGFTLIELMVALFLMAIVLLPFSQAYSATTFADNTGRLQQAAVFVADTSLDEARAVSPQQLLTGRAAGTAASAACPTLSETLPAGSTTALTQALAAVNLYESAASPCSPPIPFQPTTSNLDGYTFTTYWYTGTCYQGASSCTASAPSGNQAPLVEVIVDVTWPQAHACPQGVCSYLASTAFSNASDPTFNVGPRA